MRVGKALLGAIAAVTLLAVGCGDSAAGSGGSASVAIDEPSDGASVEVPFTIELSSGVDLGAPETGNHHVHIFFDDNSDDYEVVNGTRFVVRDLADGGEHTIHASLRKADHSEAGAEDSITVTVTGGTGGGGGGTEGEDSDDDGGYGY